MIVNGTNNLKSIENHYTSKNIRFILHFNAGAKVLSGIRVDCRSFFEALSIPS